MTGKLTTLTEFILQEESKVRGASGHFTLVLTHIEEAAKIIASHIRAYGLGDIIGKTGKKNVYEEEVKKLDDYSNSLLTNMLLGTGHVAAVFSEELEEPTISKNKKAEYIVFFDPLDGSSNIDVGITVGTIFSIYKKPKGKNNIKSMLMPGIKQVAAGYVLYGSTVMFVYTYGNGVNGFTLDPAIGTFLLSHTNMTIPKKGSIYTMNESYWNRYHPYQQQYLNYIKEEDSKSGRPYSLRYAACMVADVHRILIDGGIFVYPENKKKPQGKLRLMYEINPMSFLIKQAKGMAVSLDQDPLTIKPDKHDAKAPIAIGSPDNVKEYLRFFKKR